MVCLVHNSEHDNLMKIHEIYGASGPWFLRHFKLPREVAEAFSAPFSFDTDLLLRDLPRSFGAEGAKVMCDEIITQELGIPNRQIHQARSGAIYLRLQGSDRAKVLNELGEGFDYDFPEGSATISLGETEQRTTLHEAPFTPQLIQNMRARMRT